MCAHRYQHWMPDAFGAHLLTGQCYLLGDDLRVQTQDKTWRRVVCESEHLSNSQNNHHWFTYCQQGHGAAFSKDEQSLLLGAYSWKGEDWFLKKTWVCWVFTSRDLSFAIIFYIVFDKDILDETLMFVKVKVIKVHHYSLPTFVVFCLVVYVIYQELYAWRQ